VLRPGHRLQRRSRRSARPTKRRETAPYVWPCTRPTHHWSPWPRLNTPTHTRDNERRCGDQTPAPDWLVIKFRPWHLMLVRPHTIQCTRYQGQPINALHLRTHAAIHSPPPATMHLLPAATAASAAVTLTLLCLLCGFPAGATSGLSSPTPCPHTHTHPLVSPCLSCRAALISWAAAKQTPTSSSTTTPRSPSLPSCSSWTMLYVVA
jgi:hypothetical protein